MPVQRATPLMYPVPSVSSVSCTKAPRLAQVFCMPASPIHFILSVMISDLHNFLQNVFRALSFSLWLLLHVIFTTILSSWLGSSGSLSVRVFDPPLLRSSQHFVAFNFRCFFYCFLQYFRRVSSPFSLLTLFGFLFIALFFHNSF